MPTPQYIRDAQNSYNAKFDLVQIKLPKGAKGRIRDIIGQNASLTAYCKNAVMAALESDENSTREDLQSDLVRDVQKPSESPESEPAEELTAQKENSDSDPNNSHKASVDLSEMQALIEAKRAEQKEREEIVKQSQEQRAAEKKAEQQAEARKIIDRILSGSVPEDPEKGALREETIARSKCPF